MPFSTVGSSERRMILQHLGIVQVLQYQNEYVERGLFLVKQSVFSHLFPEHGPFSFEDLTRCTTRTHCVKNVLLSISSKRGKDLSSFSEHWLLRTPQVPSLF